MHMMSKTAPTARPVLQVHIDVGEMVFAGEPKRTLAWKLTLGIRRAPLASQSGSFTVGAGLRLRQLP
jgi:hypothetical protein